MTSEMTCADVVPMLCRHFVPHLNGMVEPGGHISLVQGESKWFMPYCMCTYMYSTCALITVTCRSIHSTFTCIISTTTVVHVQFTFVKKHTTQILNSVIYIH